MWEVLEIDTHSALGAGSQHISCEVQYSSNIYYIQLFVVLKE